MAKTNVWDCTWRGNLNCTSGKKKRSEQTGFEKKRTHVPEIGERKASSNGLTNLH
jgi:hypothetical protein